MRSARNLTISALAGVIAAMSVATSAEAASMSISGGAAVDSIPQGTSGNSVLGQAGIGFAGGQIWLDATLTNEGDIALTLFDVGSESAWKDQIQLNNSTTGATVWDNDDHGAGTSGNFVNRAAPRRPPAFSSADVPGSTAVPGGGDAIALTPSRRRP